MIKKTPAGLWQECCKRRNEYSTQMPSFFPLTQFMDSAKNSIFGEINQSISPYLKRRNRMVESFYRGVVFAHSFCDFV